MIKNNGIISVVLGKSAAKNFNLLYESIMKYKCNNVTVFTDCPHELIDENEYLNYISVANTEDKVEQRNIKINSLINSPYTETLYLDDDTRIVGDYTPLFNVLSNFRLGIALSSDDNLIYNNNHISDAFPHYNTGVIVYNIDTCSDFLKDWLNNYKRREELNINNDFKDEPSFRYTLFNSNIRFVTLTYEWNYFVYNKQVVTQQVNILHGKGDLERIIHSVNNTQGIRLLNETLPYNN